MKCILQLFRDQVAAHPDTLAIDDGNTHKVTYRDLDTLSDVLASKLSSIGVGPSDVVPILSTRCVGSVATILALYKLRACYVPMDAATWGRERVESTLSRVEPKVVITSCDADELFDGLVHGSSGGFSVLCIAPDGMPLSTPSVSSDDDYVQVSSTPSSCEHTPPGSPPLGSEKDLSHDDDEDVAEDCAYVIFTSGSTGRPKGVMIKQSSITALVTEQHPTLPFNLDASVGSRVLLIFSFAFDGESHILLP